jgi:molybdenum cofactor biosynthesis enzyme MoaA
MKILTYTAVVGTAHCNLRCPFCVAVMTPHYPKLDEINVANLKAGADLSVRGGATTFLITGKGEPTIYPDQIAKVLQAVEGKFPIVELQTNGLHLASDRLDGYLIPWKKLGLKTIAISVVHWDSKVNAMLNPREGEMPDLARLVNKLRNFGFTVRLSVVMVKGGIDDVTKFSQFIEWAKENGVHQLTFRPVTRPDEADGKVSGWVKNNCVPESLVTKCHSYLNTHGTHLLSLGFGANVFDVQGQNVCLTNCLTLDETGKEIRQLIYCSDGHIRYDWRYEGAILF